MASSDTATDVIGSIHTELDALMTPTATPYDIGRAAKLTHSDLPRVIWEMVDFEITPTAEAGGNPVVIAVLESTWHCTIWHSTLANCLAMLSNLYLASERSVSPDTARFRRGVSLTPEHHQHTNRGAVIVVECVIRAKIDDEPATIVEDFVFSTETTLYEGEDTWVHTCPPHE